MVEGSRELLQNVIIALSFSDWGKPWHTSVSIVALSFRDWEKPWHTSVSVVLNAAQIRIGYLTCSVVFMTSDTWQA